MGETPVERLRQYLRELPPGVRSLLIAELERAVLRGDDMPGTEVVLQELRRCIRETSQQADRMADAARLFFQPIEPFLAEGSQKPQPGRIARSSLESIWQWICRDLMPAEVVTLAAQIDRVLLLNDTPAAERLAHDFQDRTAWRMHDAIELAVATEKGRRKLVAQIGTQRAFDDAGAMITILNARDALAMLSTRLPGHIRNLADSQIENVKNLLDSTVGREPEVFLFALVLVMSRLANSWQLIRLAVKGAHSDAASRVAETPYAVAVTIVLAEVERMVTELAADLDRGRGIAVLALLKSVHEAVRALRTELDLPADAPWGRQLAAIRSEISRVLKTHIESIPGRARRLLRPRPANEITAQALVASDVEETESLIDFLNACRNYASELAVNEVALRTSRELEEYLDTGTQTLLEALRNAAEPERLFRQSQVAAAVRFCAKVFGKEYASLLTKAAEVAAQSERRAARA